MSKQFTLGKGERLKSRKLIGQLFSEGKNLVLTPFRVYYRWEKQVTQNPLARTSLQMGAGVSARNFKKAVDRNRVKRLIREGYRLQKNSLQLALKEKQMQLQLFIIYTGKEIPAHKEIFSQVNLVLIKIEKIIRDIL